VAGTAISFSTLKTFPAADLAAVIVPCPSCTAARRTTDLSLITTEVRARHETILIAFIAGLFYKTHDYSFSDFLFFNAAIF
jgi:hypothetical protein